MKKKIKEIESHEMFLEEIKRVKEKLGKEMLTDDDLFVLACEKILKTSTFEEKGYR